MHCFAAVIVYCIHAEKINKCENVIVIGLLQIFSTL